jgi:hypothetical protein
LSEASRVGAPSLCRSRAELRRARVGRFSVAFDARRGAASSVGIVVRYRT